MRCAVSVAVVRIQIPMLRSDIQADRLFFVVPRANMSANVELTILETCLSESYRRRVTVCFLEDIITDIERMIGTERLKEHFRLFREKYLPDSLVSNPNNAGVCVGKQ